MAWLRQEEPVPESRRSLASYSRLALEEGILIGPFGLRAGWGILLFLFVSVTLAWAFYLGSSHLASSRTTAVQEGLDRAAQRSGEAHDPPQASRQNTSKPPENQTPASRTAGRTDRPETVLLSEISETAAVLLAALGLSLVERRPFGSYGLGLRQVRDFLPGAVVGFTLLSLLVGALRVSGLLVFDRRLLHGSSALRFGAIWLLVFVLVGVFEEFLFRGYLQYTLTLGLLGLGRRLSPEGARRRAFVLASVVWSSVFVGVHVSNAGEDPLGLAAVFCAGLLFSYALWRTGSLWWGVGFHTTWDWGQSFFFGVPDSGTLVTGHLMATHAAGNPILSGGSAGPEGSLLVLPALLLGLLILRFTPRGSQPSLLPEPHRAPVTAVQSTNSL